MCGYFDYVLFLDVVDMCVSQIPFTTLASRAIN